MTTFQHIAADADEAAAEQLYLGLCETFKTWLSQVASEYGKPVEQVFDWWREYTRDCRNFDQSPVQSEFLDWYRDKLAQASVEPPI